MDYESQFKDYQEKKERYDRYIENQRKREAIENGEHKFWETQLVPKFSEIITANEPVSAPEDIDKSWSQPTPYKMPSGFEWSTVDLQDPRQLDEVYSLLSAHYVEDDAGFSRLCYSRETLRWALTPPGYFPELIIGVRATKSQALVALITGTPMSCRIYDVEVPLVEINFLCVNRKLRSKRLAPVLIKEVSRRTILRGRFQAIYSSAGPKLPTPVSSVSYVNKLLNAKKLIESGWWTLPQRSTMATEIKKYKLPPTPAHEFVLMQPEDVPQVHTLIMESLSNCKFAPVFTIEELKHLLTPCPQVVSTYVLKDTNGAVTDVFSYYNLPLTLMGNNKYSNLLIAQSLYTTATSMSNADLVTDAAVIAKNEGYDLLALSNINQNYNLVESESLNLVVSGATVHYYLYNYKCRPMEPNDVGVIFF